MSEHVAGEAAISESVALDLQLSVGDYFAMRYSLWLLFS